MSPLRKPDSSSLSFELGSIADSDEVSDGTGFPLAKQVNIRRTKTLAPPSLSYANASCHASAGDIMLLPSPVPVSHRRAVSDRQSAVRAVALPTSESQDAGHTAARSPLFPDSPADHLAPIVKRTLSWKFCPSPDDASVATMDMVRSPSSLVRRSSSSNSKSTTSTRNLMKSNSASSASSNISASVLESPSELLFSPTNVVFNFAEEPAQAAANDGVLAAGIPSVLMLSELPPMGGGIPTPKPISVPAGPVAEVRVPQPPVPVSQPAFIANRHRTPVRFAASSKPHDTTTTLSGEPSRFAKYDTPPPGASPPLVISRRVSPSRSSALATGASSATAHGGMQPGLLSPVPPASMGINMFRCKAQSPATGAAQFPVPSLLDSPSESHLYRQGDHLESRYSWQCEQSDRSAKVLDRDVTPIAKQLDLFKLSPPPAQSPGTACTPQAASAEPDALVILSGNPYGRIRKMSVSEVPAAIAAAPHSSVASSVGSTSVSTARPSPLMFSRTLRKERVTAVLSPASVPTPNSDVSPGSHNSYASQASNYHWHNTSVDSGVLVPPSPVALYVDTKLAADGGSRYCGTEFSPSKWRRGALIGQGSYGKVYRCLNSATGSDASDACSSRMQLIAIQICWLFLSLRWNLQVASAP